MYSNANRQEDLKTLLSLSDNKSQVTLVDTTIRENWVTRPETLGDVVLIQILCVLNKKIKSFILDANPIIGTPNHEVLDKKIENFSLQLKEIDFIDRMVQLLDSSSNTQKDVSILILIILTACRSILNLMMTKEFLKALINHINTFKKISKMILIFRI